MKYKLIIILIVILIPVILLAEFYKYRDKEGVFRFTDNFADVPEDQRKQADKYDELKSQIRKKKQEANNYAPTEKTDKQKLSEKIAIEERLKALKKKLDIEYQSIIKEKEEIEKKIKSKKKLKRSEALEYQQKAKLLNLRIKAYEKRREAFQKEAKTYNIQ
ncbi:putative DUF4124 domain-containing protein [Candidatus Magnetomoraceae bacterium gMMP-1]